MRNAWSSVPAPIVAGGDSLRAPGICVRGTTPGTPLSTEATSMEENLVLLSFAVTTLLLCAAVRIFFARGGPALKTHRKLSLVCGNLLVTLLLLSLIVLAGEIYFRYCYDTTDSFGLTKTTKRWYERHFRNNASGFRDSEQYSPSIRPGLRRVSFIGDSFTAGHGIANVEDRFANRIRASRPQYEVHVLAQPGWDTGGQLELLDFIEESGYELDIVVLVYCLNDIADIIPEWREILDRVYDAPEPGFLVQHSFLLNTMNGRIRAAREPEVADYYGFVRAGYEGPLWNRQKERLLEIHDRVTAAGGRLLVVTFPFLHALGDDYGFLEVHHQLGEFWREQEVPHLDLLSTYAALPPEDLVVNAHDVHPNERAHALAADAMMEFLDRTTAGQ